MIKKVAKSVLTICTGTGFKSASLRMLVSWGPPYAALFMLLATISHNYSLWIASVGIASMVWGYGFYFYSSFKSFAPPTEKEFLNLAIWYVVIGLLIVGLYAFYYHSFNLAHLWGVNSKEAKPLMDQFGLSIYFSFVTFTTLGYGDITPSHPAGRYLAASEAFIGTLHMVSFIALWLSRPRKEASAE